ncbi:hypothetical protein BC834DRAFT_669846 [Gloeopeniophorella convolvens]|nr:hypothetical protein BC834DRAFT_669846 [Gloeopeniophorella convolvens]
MRRARRSRTRQRTAYRPPPSVLHTRVYSFAPAAYRTTSCLSSGALFLPRSCLLRCNRTVEHHASALYGTSTHIPATAGQNEVDKASRDRLDEFASRLDQTIRLSRRFPSDAAAARCAVMQANSGGDPSASGTNRHSICGGGRSPSRRRRRASAREARCRSGRTRTRR